MAYRIESARLPPVFYIPERVMAVTPVERDDRPVRASIAGFDSGFRGNAPALREASATGWTAPVTPEAAAVSPLSAGRSELAPAADANFARLVPNVASSGSFLSNRGSDPLGVGDELAAQQSAYSNSESVGLASAEAAVGHHVAMDLINNIRAA